MKVVIVGGVAGGASAAARIRRLDESAEIKIFERTGYVSYANCGLPYFIGGEIENREDLTLQTPKSFKERFNIDVFVNHEVIKINKDKKTVLVKDLTKDYVFEESYDKLLLAPGAHPILPEVVGVGSKRIFTLRTVEDTFEIFDYIKSQKVKTATVVGGGFIGLEMVENLINQKIKVNLVQKGDHVLNPVDFDMASLLHAELRKNGVNLLLNKNVVEFKETASGIRAVFEEGEEIESQIIILAIGVLPETSLAKDAGLELGEKGSIVVNERMETSEKDIFAVGDAVAIKHLVTGTKAVISLAGPANKQGRIVADNICGRNSKFVGGLGTSVLKLFSLTTGIVGLNESLLKRVGVNYEKVVLSPANHATYYPGAQAMTMKVIFDPKTEKVFGAQIVGHEGVDKRIDVIATAMFNNMKASDLKDLDLAYAPPYSSAKDPVNMAGFMIDNIVTGTVKQFYYEDLENIKKDKNAFLLDTRTINEFKRGHADGFVNIPVDSLRKELSKLDKNKKIYVMCQSGLRSYIATRILMQNGFDAYNFAGGFRYYQIVHDEKCVSSKIMPCGMEIKNAKN